jgi:hypothetical protein
MTFTQKARSIDYQIRSTLIKSKHNVEVHDHTKYKLYKKGNREKQVANNDERGNKSSQIKPNQKTKSK